MKQVKQVKFRDTINDEVFGGIMLEDGSIICGCCGYVISSALVGDAYRIVEEYSEWVDLSKEITGEDYE